MNNEEKIYASFDEYGRICGFYDSSSPAPPQNSIEITDEQRDAFLEKQNFNYEPKKEYAIVNGMWTYRDKVITEAERIQQERDNLEFEIIQLKRSLAADDYKTSKYVDGDYTEAEWAEIVMQRKAWRTRIREIEAILGL